MEKRKFARVPLKLKAHLYYQGKYILAEIENLSLQGMFVKTDIRPEIGSKLEIKAYLDEIDEALIIKVRGKIIRYDSNGLGIFFDDLDLNSFTHLKRILEYNTATPENVETEFIRSVQQKLAGT